MTKHNMMFTLLSNFISHDDIAGILAEYGFEDTARKCDVSTLLAYLVGAATFEWKSLRHAADVAASYGVKAVDYSTLSKRLGALNYLIVKRIFDLIVGRLNRATRRHKQLQKSLLAIDSTTVTVGKTRLPWALYHGERAGIKLHVSYTNATNLPLQVVETTAVKHDGPIGVQLEDKRFILVADRAYFSITKVDRYTQTGQDFVLRLKKNLHISHRKALKRTAVLGSNVTADFTCRLGTSQKQSMERHRIVEFLDAKGDVIRVVTNLRHVAAEEIADMYKERWAIESFFRLIKQYLNVPILFGTTENAVFSQLFAALIAYVLLTFLQQACHQKPHCQPLSFAGFVRQLLCDALPVEWRLAIKDILTFHRGFYQLSSG